ncbi:MAG: lipoate--protein ligase [Lachnospiraceae bacterium]|nr:lipoate--protein ligase [Lachnospiraceae bacterium]
MRLILTNSLDPYYNLACEEYYFRDTEDDVFMLWQNRPTVVIGRNQNLYDEVDLSYTEKEGIEVVRRITGGGAVYHDLGNVNYSFITSREKAAVLDFDYFTRPIRDTLLSLGIEAVLSGRNDLVVSAPDGSFLKFSGNAETATDRRILSHGTLLFDSDLGVLSKALKPDPEKLKKRAIQSVRSRVTNLKPLVSDQKMETPEFFRFSFAPSNHGTGSQEKRLWKRRRSAGTRNGTGRRITLRAEKRPMTGCSGSVSSRDLWCCYMI